MFCVTTLLFGTRDGLFLSAFSSLEAMHLFLIANIVTTSKALVTRSDALVSTSFLLLLLVGSSKPKLFSVVPLAGVDSTFELSDQRSEARHFGKSLDRNSAVSDFVAVSSWLRQGK